MPSNSTEADVFDLTDVLDAIQSLRLVPPPFTPVTCRPTIFENPAVGASTDSRGVTEDSWHLVMKPKGCLLRIQQGIYREYEDVVAQLPGFKLEDSAPLRYRKFTKLEQAELYWADVCSRLHEHPEWNAGTRRRTVELKLQKQVRQARSCLLFNEIAKLEPEVFSTSRVVAPLASPVGALRVARLPMNDFRVYLLARVEDIVCCRPFEDLMPARDLHHSFIDQQIFTRLYLAQRNAHAIKEFEKEERRYSVAIETALERLDLSI